MLNNYYIPIILASWFGSINFMVINATFNNISVI